MGARSVEIGRNEQTIGRPNRRATTLLSLLFIIPGGGAIAYGDAHAIWRGIQDGTASSSASTPQKLASELDDNTLINAKKVSNITPDTDGEAEKLILDLGLITAGETSIVGGIVIFRRRRSAASQPPTTAYAAFE